MLRSRLAFGLLLLALLIPAALTTAQNSVDRHIVQDKTRSLYLRSAFAHGYIYGYEDGFHFADLDVQMGRAPRDPETLKELRSSKCGYRREFGNKDVFRRAYREGFRVAYADALAGREFRAVDEGRVAAAGLEDPSTANANFDSGFSSGYFAGRSRGLRDGRARAAWEESAPGCEVDGRGPQGTLGMEYCEGFRRGNTFGYSDGYLNQAVDSRTRTARK